MTCSLIILGNYSYISSVDHVAWCSWYHDTNQYLHFPVDTSSVNPKANGDWMTYMLETARIIEQLPIDDEAILDAASTGDRTGSDGIGLTIEETHDNVMNFVTPHPMPSEAWPSPPVMRSAREIMDSTQLVTIGDNIFNIARTKANEDCEWLQAWRSRRVRE